MGLDITGFKSKKTYHGGYYGLHRIRYLALLSCGFPPSNSDDFLEGYPMYYSLPPSLAGDKLGDMIWASTLAGYAYPNLMLHSDCEGTYTKKGKIAFPKLLTGNSVELLKELKKMRSILASRYKQGKAWRLFKMFYAVVKDEVEHGNGYIDFH